MDIKDITYLQATGLYNELIVALRLTSDHLKFMRMFSDPTEIDMFIRATELANVLDNIRDKIREIDRSYFNEPIPPERILELVQISLIHLNHSVEFLNDVANKAQGCRAYVQISPGDIQHLRRETDFFLGVFDSTLEEKFSKDAKTLGIPIRNQLMATIPRVLIDKLPIDQAEEALLAWTFWVNQNSEHTALLRSLTHPEDTQLIHTLNKFEKHWKDLFELIVRNPMSIIPQVTINADNWNDFLSSILIDIKICKIREIFPQRMVEHMIIENELLTETVARFLHNTQNIVLSPEPKEGVVYDQFTPKAVLLTYT